MLFGRVYRSDQPPPSLTTEPCFFRVYPLKFNLIAAESQTGPVREEDDRFRHTNLRHPWSQRQVFPPLLPQVWDHFSCQFKCVRYRTTQRLDIHYRTPLPFASFFWQVDSSWVMHFHSGIHSFWIKCQSLRLNLGSTFEHNITICPTVEPCCCSGKTCVVASLHTCQHKQETEAFFVLVTSRHRNN